MEGNILCNGRCVGRRKACIGLLQLPERIVPLHHTALRTVIWQSQCRNCERRVTFQSECHPSKFHLVLRCKDNLFFFITIKKIPFDYLLHYLILAHSLRICQFLDHFRGLFVQLNIHIISRLQGQSRLYLPHLRPLHYTLCRCL